MRKMNVCDAIIKTARRVFSFHVIIKKWREGVGSHKVIKVDKMQKICVLGM